MPLSHRLERVGEEIRTVLAEVIQQQMSDPRMPAILSITKVEVTRDLGQATVHFTQIPEDEESIEDALEALAHAAGFLQSAVAERVSMRTHPKLRFRYDYSVGRQARMEELLKRAEGTDAERAARPRPAETEDES